MKKNIDLYIKRSILLLLCCLSIIPTTLYAQNVGIGTTTPSKKLSVNGSIAVDHDLKNIGTLDSAALIFGNDGLTGISSSKAGGTNINGIDMWTNGARRFSINQNGYAGIGTLPNNIHRLNVNGRFNATGNISTSDSLFVNANVGIGTAPDAFAKLKVNGLARFNSGQFQYDLSVGGFFHTEGFLSAANGATIAGKLEGYEVKANETLRVGEYAAIGGLLDSTFRLRVYGGNSRFGGSVEATGNMTIGGTLDDTYRLRVIGGDSRFGGSVEATGNLTIGGALDNTYKLRVIGGNSRFGGDAQVTGNLNVGGNIDLSGQLNAGSANISALAIGGKGSVRSDGLSPLRIGFNSKSINVVLPAGAVQDFTVNITDFGGDNDDVRVMVSQFQYGAGAGANSWERTLITVSDVNAAADTCKINVHNTTANQLTIVGTIYLTTIAKN